MGFTGKAALAWKVKFIEAFNAMEAALKEKEAKKAKQQSHLKPTLLESLQLSPWDKITLGKQACTLLEDPSIGPHTRESLLLKLRYTKAIQDVQRLAKDLSADLLKTTSCSIGQTRVSVQQNRAVSSDSFIETLCDDQYRLLELGMEFNRIAFRALNTGICMAAMQKL